MYSFEVKQRDRSKILSAFHILIALILILDLLHVHQEGKKDWLFFSVFLIAGISLGVLGLSGRRILKALSQQLIVLLIESGLIFSGAIYFWSKGVSLVSFSHGVVAGSIILFWIYLKRRVNGESIVVTEHQVIVPGIAGERIVEWTLLTNVVKKYDLITFDFKSNKLLQIQVENDAGVSDQEFNSFCEHCLSQAGQKK